MTTILVTAASGHLGRLTVEALLERGVPGADIVATSRNVDALADLAGRGVTTRHLDYSDTASIDAALVGVDRVLLVSGTEFGQRVQQHANVIDAAARAGVELLAYTSIPKADTTDLILAQEHRGTEEYLATAPVPSVFLRNSWYFENYTDQLPVHLQLGAIYGAAGDGRISAASRADYAAAAAAVLTVADAASIVGTAYELGGDTPITLADYAAAVTAATGTDVEYRDVPQAEFASVLVGAGVPEVVAGVLADADRGIAAGALFVDSGTLSGLIGRPTTTLADAVASAVAVTAAV